MASSVPIASVLLISFLCTLEGQQTVQEDVLIEANSLDSLKSMGWAPAPADQWQEWIVPMYAEAVRVTSRLNRNSLDSCSDWDESEDIGDGDAFDFPVFVMNLPSRADRQQHMRCLLRSLGFTNVSFPPSTLASELDVVGAIKEGLIAPSLIDDLRNTEDFGEKAALAYAANAMDMLRCMEEALAAGVPLFGIFEDDLVRASSHAATRQRIREAVAELPASADMLYLEVCFELCDHALFSPAHPRLLAAHKPMCSAAILYTAKGARRVLEECRPVWHGIDVMLPRLVQRGRLAAFVARPQAFFQDGAWGSDAQRTRRFEGASEREGAPQHRIWLPTCMESEPFLYDQVDPLHPATLLTPALLPADPALDLPTPTAEVRELWLAAEQSGWRVPEGGAVVYYTQDALGPAAAFSVEVGVWRGEAGEGEEGEEGLRLAVPPRSACWSSAAALCPLELVLEGADGGELDARRRFVFLDFGRSHDPRLDPALPPLPPTAPASPGHGEL